MRNQKKFKVRVGPDNSVSLIDEFKDNILMQVKFQEKDDAQECKKSLEYLCDLFNEPYEELEKEKEKYSQLFDTYWDLKKKMNQISNVIYEYDNNIRTQPLGLTLGSTSIPIVDFQKDLVNFDIPEHVESEKVEQVVKKAFDGLDNCKEGK